MIRTPIRFALLCSTTAAAIAFASPALAQSRPFPTSAKYSQGYVPESATTAVVQSSYDNWKTNYLKTDCGNGYVRVDNALGDGSTFSEGQGYGMVLTAYFGDKTSFDGLWSFAQKNYDSDGLMGWHVTCSGATTSDGGSGSATDGDTDIGFGLIVAAAQWGGSYLEDAKTYLATLKAKDFTTCSPSGRNIPNAGQWQGSGACTAAGGGSNTSYWMPGYYRVFAAMTGDSFWSKAADDVVALYNLAADPATGIIVNEVDQDGVALSGQTYDYNSCRIPWRAALDYLWYGTAGAQQATTKITNWANSVGIANIVDGYDADGTPTGTNKQMNEFVGGFTVGAMANSQALVTTFAADFVGIADDNGTYYGSSLRTLYLLELSGNEWNPVEALGVDGGSGSGSGPSSGGGGSSGSGSGSSSSGGGAGSSSGTHAGSSSGGVSGADGGTAIKDTAGGPSSGGCGCVTAGEAPATSGLLALAGLVGLAVRRKKRVSS
jgi:endoglucanase